MTDKRSLKEQFESALTAFNVLKHQAKQTGKKLVNIKAVATSADIDRKYLYGNIETPDKEIITKFKKLGEDVAAWKRAFSADCSTSDSHYVDELSQLKRAHKATIKQNAVLLARHKELNEMFSEIVTQRDDAQDSLKKSEATVFKLQVKIGSKSNVASFDNGSVQRQNKTKIISPDDFLMIKNRYQGQDSYQRKVAWGEAIDLLSDELLKPIPTTLYITIGVPGSGKSKWAEKQISSRRSVIFDATNLTMSSRHEIFRIAKQSGLKDLKIIAVCFPISVDKAKLQNAQRKKERRIPDDVIEQADARIEFPNFNGAFSVEAFDEILIIKESSK